MTKDTQITFGPVSGKAGDVRLASASPTCAFKGAKLIALDTAGGHATLVRQIYVDNAPIFPRIKFSRWRRLLAWLHLRKLPSIGLPTVTFNHLAVGNGIDLPVCGPAKIITVEVVFLVAGEWRGAFLGYTATR